MKGKKKHERLAGCRKSNLGRKEGSSGLGQQDLEHSAFRCAALEAVHEISRETICTGRMVAQSRMSWTKTCWIRRGGISLFGHFPVGPVSDILFCM